MTVVVVGKSGFMAQALQKDAACAGWIFLGHQEALRDTAWVDKATVLINCAFSPALRSGAYARDQDIDADLALLVAGKPVHYIMLSSRTVYGSASEGLREDQGAHPSTPYAINKLVTENLLRDTLGAERLTILRIGNVFGFEKGRQSFFGLSLTALAETGMITFNMAADAERDFLAVWRFAAALAVIAHAPVGGVFNLGAGYATPCEKIAAWIIAGYDAGRLEVRQAKPRNSFWLDMSKTRATWPIETVTPEQLEADCRLCGEWLRSLA